MIRQLSWCLASIWLSDIFYDNIEPEVVPAGLPAALPPPCSWTGASWLLPHAAARLRCPRQQNRAVWRPPMTSLAACSFCLQFPRAIRKSSLRDCPWLCRFFAHESALPSSGKSVGILCKHNFVCPFPDGETAPQNIQKNGSHSIDFCHFWRYNETTCE